MRMYELILTEARRNVAPGRYGEMEMFEISNRRDLVSLIKRFGVVRAMLHDNYMNGWDASDYTHGDYEEHWGEGINLSVSADDAGGYEIIIENINPAIVRANPAFKSIFGKSKVRFIDAETYEPIQ